MRILDDGGDGASATNGGGRASENQPDDRGSVRGSASPQWVVHETVVTVVTKKMILWYDSCFIVSGDDRASAEVRGDVAGGPRERENARRGVETNERENDAPFACGFYR